MSEYKETLLDWMFAEPEKNKMPLPETEKDEYSATVLDFSYTEKKTSGKLSQQDINERAWRNARQKYNCMSSRLFDEESCRLCDSYNPCLAI